MEAIIAQNDASALVQPLDFTLADAASYIIAREQQTFGSIATMSRCIPRSQPRHVTL